MTPSYTPPAATDPEPHSWFVEYFTEYIAKEWEIAAAETAIYTTMGDGPYLTPLDRIRLHDAFSYGPEDAPWKGPLLAALIVHITAGMVMALPKHPDDDFIVDYLSGLWCITGIDPDRVRALHEAAQARVSGEVRAFADPGQWLSTASALAGFWILEPDGGPEKYQDRELTTEEAIERARPVVDFFYGNVLTPEAAGWVFYDGSDA